MYAPSAENTELRKVASVTQGGSQNIALNALPTVRNSAFVISAFSIISTSPPKQQTNKQTSQKQNHPLPIKVACNINTESDCCL